MHRDLERLLEFSVREELDRVVHMTNEPPLEEGIHVDRCVGIEAIEVTDVDDLILDAKNVREAALGQTALQRHLAAFVVRLARVTPARLGTFVTARGRLAVARTGAAADALALFLRALCGLEISETHVT